MAKLFTISQPVDDKNIVKKKRKRRTKAQIAEDREKEIQAELAAEIEEKTTGIFRNEPDFVVELDFTLNPYLLQVVEQVAKKQFRSVQQQIMFVLNEFCSDFIYEGKE